MSDGMNFAPIARHYSPVVAPGEFVMAATHLDHGHIYGMVGNLVEAGATCKYVYDPNPRRVEYFRKQNPKVKVAASLEEILQDKEVQLVAAAAIPNQRAALGIQVMQHGKDYFTDKTPMTSLAQLAQVESAIARTGQKFACCYSERLQNEAAEFAVELIRDRVIGDVIQVIGLGPHRLAAKSRPDWFFSKPAYGGIICDIGSHQAEQFLTYTGSTDATVLMARTHNYAHPQYPELEDFGDFSLVGNNQSSGYFRMDWFTPDGLRTWGDGRTTILGTRGFIELRKYVDIGREDFSTDNVFVVTETGESHHQVAGKIGFPFFGRFILDCLSREEVAMTQAHCLKAVKICLNAQAMADLER